MIGRSPIADCRLKGVAVALLAVVMIGCKSTSPVTPGATPAVDPNVVQGYRLLYDLVSRQKDVGKVFVLKKASAETTTIVKEIGSVAGDATSQLEAFAKERGIDLKTDPLPKFERATRDAIQSRTTKYLLFGGDDFETKLIYTQMNACEYGAMLAGELAKLDLPDAHRAYIGRFAQRYEAFFDQLVVRLTTR